MSDLEFLERYGGQSVDELIALEGEYRTDSIVLAFEEALEQKAAEHGAAALGLEEQVVLAIEALEREVNNGGYELFFLNSSRHHAVNVVRALDTIQCPGFAETARHALAALGVGEDYASDRIVAALDSGGDDLVDRLGHCDDEYFAIEDEDIASRLFEFIKANRARISFGVE